MCHGVTRRDTTRLSNRDVRFRATAAISVPGGSWHTRTYRDQVRAASLLPDAVAGSVTTTRCVWHLHSQVDCFASVVCCPGAIFDVARPQRTAHGFVALVTSADAHTARTSDSHTLEHHRSLLLRTSSPRSSPPVDRHVFHRARQRLVRRKLHCSVVSRPRHSSDSSKSNLKGP